METFLYLILLTTPPTFSLPVRLRLLECMTWCIFLILWDLEYMTWFDFLLSISYSQLGLSSVSRFTVYGIRSISTFGSVFCIIWHGGAIFGGVPLVKGWIWGYVVVDHGDTLVHSISK
jgi:hypothetical protein